MTAYWSLDILGVHSVLLKDRRFGTAERCWEISQGYAFFAYPWY